MWAILLCPSAGQVRDRHPHAALVVHRHRVQAVVLRHPVHQHHRQARPGRVGEQRVAQVRGGEHHPVHVAGAHLLEHEPLPLAVAVGVADQRDVPGRREPVLQRPHDRREQRVGQVGDEHANGVGAPGPQAPGHRVGVVAEDLGGLEHPARRVLPDQQPGLRVERPRGGGRVNARPRCDVPQGYRAFSHRHLAPLCARGQRPPADRCLTRCYLPAPAIARHSRAAWRRFLGFSGPGARRPGRPRR